MTMKLLIMAGGVLLLLLGGAAIRYLRARANRITPDQLSGDWLAQARGREEHHPW
jgi:hypothetical protein